jgi:DUF971 family protein
MAPHSISHDTAANTVEIHWPDATVQQLSGTFLRQSCRCAHCLAIQRHGKEAPSITGETGIVDIVPVGSYAVQLLFGDGHARGIFPWSYLKSLAAT